MKLHNHFDDKRLFVLFFKSDARQSPSTMITTHCKVQKQAVIRVFKFPWAIKTYPQNSLFKESSTHIYTVHAHTSHYVTKYYHGQA